MCAAFHQRRRAGLALVRPLNANPSVSHAATPPSMAQPLQFKT